MAIESKPIKAQRTGDLILGRAEDGSIAYLDLSERFTEREPSYLCLPFQIEYSCKSDGREVFGDTYCMQPISFFEEKNTCTFVYRSRDGVVQVTVRQEVEDGVLSQTAEAENLSQDKLCIKQLYNLFNGIAVDCFSDDFARRVQLGVVRGEWGGEGQLTWVRPEELGLVRATGHKTGCTGEIWSNSAYTTRKVSPMLFFRDTVSGHVWFVQHLPDGPYCLEIGLTDAERIPGSCYQVGCGAGRSDKHGFRLYLEPGERYRCCKTVVGCAESFDQSMKVLTAYRRRHLKRHPSIPLMFNDYMNCLWGKLDTPACSSMIEAAQRAGAEGYCFDDGWYRDRNVHGSTHLGDWTASGERFEGKSFRDLIADINARGMVAGLWTELEVCSLMSDAARLPDSYFLHNEGTRIYRCGRLYFDFSQESVRRYLTDKVREIYEMGIRYIKNDYNGHPGCNVDWPNASGLAGAEQHCRAVFSFYEELRRKFPDLRMESCASGAMRADGHTLENFDVQSISDCEEYEKMPSILNGTLLQLLPEQIGIWAYPYPRIFWEMNGEEYLTEQYRAQMSDGRQTAFNMITGMMGRLYLSGKIDRADAFNFSLICRATALYKELREEIAESYPVYPLGTASWLDETSVIAQGFRHGKHLLLAVWRRLGEQKDIVIPCGEVISAVELYPGDSCPVELDGSALRVTIPQTNQAVLLRIELR